MQLSYAIWLIYYAFFASNYFRPTSRTDLAMLNLWHLKHILELTLIKGLFSLSKSCNLLFLCDKQESDRIMHCQEPTDIANFVLKFLIKFHLLQKNTNYVVKMLFACKYLILICFCKNITKDEVEMESDKQSQCRSHDQSLAVDDDWSLTVRSSTSSHSVPYHQTAIGINIFML